MNLNVTKKIFTPKGLVLFLCLLVFGFYQNSQAQSHYIDSLRAEITNAKDLDQKSELTLMLGQYYKARNKDSALFYFDSVKLMALKLGNDELFINTALETADFYYDSKQRDTAKVILEKALIKASESNNVLGMARTLNMLAYIQYKENSYNESQTNFVDALELLKKIDDKPLESKIWNRLGLVNKRLGNYDEAFSCMFKSLAIDEELNNLRGQGITMSNLGLLYERMGKPELALDYLQKSLKIREQTNNAVGKSYVYHNIGLVYEGMNEFEKALEYYEKSMVLKDSLNDIPGIAKLYSNMGIVYVGLKDFTTAIEYFKKALDMRLKVNNKSGAAHTMVNIAQLYETKNQYNQALNYYDKGMELAEQLKDIHQKRRILIGYSNCYDSLGHPEKALMYYKKYHEVRDSLFNMEKERNINQLEVKYQTLKKEKENQALHQEVTLNKEKIKRQKLIGALLLVVIIVFFVLAVVIITSRRRIKKALALVSVQKNEIQAQANQIEENYKQLQEFSLFKEDMINMVIHDLKNPIGIILNVNRITDYPNKKKVIHQAVDQMNMLVMNLLDVHKMEESAVKLDLTDFWLNDLLEKVVGSLAIHLEQKSLTINNEIHANYLIHADASIIERVVLNLLTNAIKFSPVSDTISLYVTESIPNKIIFHVKDHGTGIAADKTQEVFKRYNQIEKRALGYSGSTGIGLTFCKLAIETHHEQIGLTSEQNKGADFYFSLTYKTKKSQNVSKPKVKPEGNFKLSDANKKQLQPYAYKLEELGLHQVTKARNVIKQIPKENTEIKRLCELLDASILDCNSRVFENLINLIT